MAPFFMDLAWPQWNACFMDQEMEEEQKCGRAGDHKIRRGPKGKAGGTTEWGSKCITGWLTGYRKLASTSNMATGRVFV